MRRIAAAMIFGFILSSTSFCYAQATSTPNIQSDDASTTGEILPDSSVSASPLAVGVTIDATQVSYGDLVAYDKTSDQYVLTSGIDDPNVFGVVVQHPALVFMSYPSEVPVVTSGDALVNVTLENGAIEPGDEITSSSIPGKGMRAQQDNVHTIGVAQEPFTTTSSSQELLMPNGQPIAAGTIVVDLAINTTNGLGNNASTSAQTAGTAQPGGDCSQDDVFCEIVAKLSTANLVTIARYFIAGIVALGSLFLAFRSFVSDVNNGVISVGRNPRAKSTIQAMVLFNAILAICLAAAGLFVAMLVLFVPL